MQKSVNQKSTVRNLLCHFIRFPGPLREDRNPCEVPFNWAISRHAFKRMYFEIFRT